MWVKGSPLQFLVDRGSQKNLISLEVMKRLNLLTIAYLQPYTIRWLHPRRDLHIRQQCCLPYSIKSFTDEVLCDVAPLEFFYVLLGQPYLWKSHVLYESRLHTVIITLGNNLYRILEAVPPPVIYLTTEKNTVRLFPKPRKLFSLKLAHRKRRISWPQPRNRAPLHGCSRWTKSQRNTRTYSPHLQGYLFTVRSCI